MSMNSKKSIISVKDKQSIIDAKTHAELKLKGFGVRVTDRSFPAPVFDKNFPSLPSFFNQIKMSVSCLC